jgi:hypothetical protein
LFFGQFGKRHPKIGSPLIGYLTRLLQDSCKAKECVSAASTPSPPSPFTFERLSRAWFSAVAGGHRLTPTITDSEMKNLG